MDKAKKAREVVTRRSFNLWSMFLAEGRFQSPRSTNEVLWGEKITAWTKTLAALIEEHVTSPYEKDRALEAIVRIGTHNLFSCANVLVRRGLLPPDQVSASAILIFG